MFVCFNHTKSDSDQEHANLPTTQCSTAQHTQKPQMNLSIILSPKYNHKEAVVQLIYGALCQDADSHGIYGLSAVANEFLNREKKNAAIHYILLLSISPN